MMMIFEARRRKNHHSARFPFFFPKTLSEKPRMEKNKEVIRIPKNVWEILRIDIENTRINKNILRTYKKIIKNKRYHKKFKYLLRIYKKTI